MLVFLFQDRYCASIKYGRFKDLIKVKINGVCNINAYIINQWILCVKQALY